MERKHALYLASSVGTLAFAAAFVLPAFVPHRVLWYYPLEGRWAFEVKATGLAMDFYGRALQGAVASAIAAAVAYGVGLRVKALGAKLLGVVLAWAITATLFAMLQYSWTLYVRHPMPAPLPSGYTPR